ncbi:MAG: HepT-like ribonuclease domain-containing protein [Phormidesmis sp.]
MTKRSINDYFQDVLDTIAAVEQFTEDVNFEEFSQNLEKIFAVSRAFEIIGEAVKNVPDSIRANHPDVPWRILLE